MNPTHEDLTRGASIAIIGTGALGSALLKQLIRQGKCSVLLVDADRVQDRNLVLSPLLQEAMLLRKTASPVLSEVFPYKAELLARHVREMYGCNAFAAVSEIADVGWETLRDLDTFYCCTDSALSRAETACIARMLGKPMIDGGVFGLGFQEGRVSRFPPSPTAACYLCGMSEESRAAVLGYAASASMGCQAPREEAAMTGTLRTVQAIAERMAAPPHLQDESLPEQARAEKVFLEEDQAAAGSLRCESFMLTRSATCPWHDGLPPDLQSLPWDVPLRRSMGSLNGGSGGLELQLAWPVCIEAECAACGSRSEPFVRVASVRRTLHCANCGQAGLQPVRAVHRIRLSDPLSERSPRQLGQPSRHLYWLREGAGMNGLMNKDAT